MRVNCKILNMSSCPLILHYPIVKFYIIQFMVWIASNMMIFNAKKTLVVNSAMAANLNLNKTVRVL